MSNGTKPLLMITETGSGGCIEENHMHREGGGGREGATVK